MIFADPRWRKSVPGRTIFDLPGIEGHKQEYVLWLLSQCSKAKIRPEDIFTDEAIAVLTEKLLTPLQFEHYMSLALEKAFTVAEKPVTADVVNTVLARDIEDPRGYSDSAGV